MSCSMSRVFAKACTALGVAPARALYVGDRASHDVVPARAAGMRTVLYHGAAGRYRHEEGPADHVVDDLRDLLPVLRDTYGVAA